MRELLRLDRNALWQKFQNARNTAKTQRCLSLFKGAKYGPSKLNKLGWTKKEIAFMVRQVQQDCIIHQPIKHERKYFRGINMTGKETKKNNKNYVPRNNSNNNNNNLYNRYTNNKNAVRTIERNLGNSPWRKRYKWELNMTNSGLNNNTLRAYLTNRIKERFGVDPNKNIRFKGPVNNKRYLNSTAFYSPKIEQYAETLRTPGKLIGKKKFGKRGYKNWYGVGVPMTLTGRGHSNVNSTNQAKRQRALARRILHNISLGNSNLSRNLNNADKMYARRLYNKLYNNKKPTLLTNAVANNVLKRFGKRTKNSSLTY